MLAVRPRYDRAAALVVLGFCGAAGVLISRALPSISPLVAALAVGFLVGNVASVDGARPHVATFGTVALRAGIVLLGLQLDVASIGALGVPALAAVLIVLSSTVTAGVVIASRVVGDDVEGTLIGTGFGVCGASAIAVAGETLNAKPSQLATALSLTTAVGSLSLLVVPALSSVLGLSPATHGAWAGMGVHDVGQVVAVGSAAAAPSLDVAVTLKVARVALLAPVAALLSAFLARGAAQRSRIRFPPFLLLFGLAAATRAVGILDAHTAASVRPVQVALLAAAMGATGSALSLATVRAIGRRGLTAAVFCWSWVTAAGLIAAVLVT